MSYNIEKITLRGKCDITRQTQYNVAFDIMQIENLTKFELDVIRLIKKE